MENGTRPITNTENNPQDFSVVVSWEYLKKKKTIKSFDKRWGKKEKKRKIRGKTE